MVTEPMFKEAVLSPIKQMILNAGMHPATVLGVLKNNPPVLPVDRLGVDFRGIDFTTKDYVANMVGAGIIDPFKVTRLALESATAITKSVIGMETAIVQEDEPTDAKE